MLQVSWTINPVTVIDIEYHKARALGSTLSEAIPFTFLPQATSHSTHVVDHTVGGWRGKRTLVGLIKFCLLLVTWFQATDTIFLSFCFLTYKIEIILHWSGHSEIAGT